MRLPSSHHDVVVLSRQIIQCRLGSSKQHGARVPEPKIHTDAPEPTLFIAIGGGGFIPARILRTFLKTSSDGGKKKNIPIQAVGLTLYEDMGGVGSTLLFNDGHPWNGRSAYGAQAIYVKANPDADIGTHWKVSRSIGRQGSSYARSPSKVKRHMQPGAHAINNADGPSRS